MKISLLQPHIQRGDIINNRKHIQTLINQAEGDLLVLPEYGLTGSLTLENSPEPFAWAEKCAREKENLKLASGKFLMVNSLVMFADGLRNCCELLPTTDHYCKLFPDKTELQAGVLPGLEFKIFSLEGKRFSVLICFDLPNIMKIPMPELDFLLFIYHFTPQNFSRVMEEVKEANHLLNLPILISSLVSDYNHGHSAFVNQNLVITLGRQAGILEINLE
ncbi:MAG: hypothetical protein KatS3mg045_1057 [Bellilinea sp.]|nr:MAG: hypothetical protein KatS3mg045_1057 [Bellilinea sp.]